MSESLAGLLVSIFRTGQVNLARRTAEVEGYLDHRNRLRFAIVNVLVANFTEWRIRWVSWFLRTVNLTLAQVVDAVTHSASGAC